jgi:hypothetical protein
MSETLEAGRESLVELIADLRHNAEEWSATMHCDWLDAVVKSEEKITAFVASLEKDKLALIEAARMARDYYGGKDEQRAIDNLTKVLRGLA